MQGPPPPPPPPPAFMTMNGYRLACFDKPTFEEDGLEFFVCNGGRGLAGVRKKSDPKHIIFVKDPDIAQNLDMQIAKAACNGGRFGVRMGADGIVYFVCAGAEMEHNENFKAVSKTDWKKYSAYLDK